MAAPGIIINIPIQPLPAVLFVLSFASDTYSMSILFNMIKLPFHVVIGCKLELPYCRKMISNLEHNFD